MPSFTYISFKKFALQVALAFRENILREQVSSTQSTDPTHEADKVRVSLNDLKIISSALLHFKKILLKKNETAKAKAVAEVDERIYELIINIEQAREFAARDGVAA